MPNTQLRQHIDDMPGILAKLERIPEITTRLDLIDTLRAHALSLEPLDGVETMALSDYDRDWLVRYTYNSNAIEGSTLTLQDTSLVLEGEFVPSDSPVATSASARCSTRPDRQHPRVIQLPALAQVVAAAGQRRERHHERGPPHSSPRTPIDGTMGSPAISARCE